MDRLVAGERVLLCTLRQTLGSRAPVVFVWLATHLLSEQCRPFSPREPMNQPQAFEEHFFVRWSDLDANRHVRNTLFSEFATHTRFRLLAANGFSQTRFESLRFGPVMFREEIRYRRELLFGDQVAVNVLFAGLSDDGSQWRVHQEVTRADGKQAAILTIDGAWIHLDTRKLVAPPDELLQLFQRLPRTEDFELLRSVLRQPGSAPG
jgi:acyl-CoA thioester hydrolase